MTSIRFWILLFINVLIITAVLVVSVFFYREFEKTLDDRVLLQLTSIKTLKRLRIEEYIEQEWKSFLDASIQNDIHTSNSILSIRLQLNESAVDTLCLRKRPWYENPETGIYDLSPCTKDEKTRLMFVHKSDSDRYHIKIVEAQRIQEILLERTGMGQSGESYLVGDDYNLRSESRFYPDTPSNKIKAETLGVTRSFSGTSGRDIILDYRGIPVYSAYDLLDVPNINWVILSEIDVEEVTVPLRKMKTKLAITSSLVILLATLLSMAIANVLSNPLLKMRLILSKMAKGDFQFNVSENNPVREIDEIFTALSNLRDSINKAIHFSSEIGKMNLDAQYKLSGQNDTLGKSLISMQKKLIEYENIGRQNRREAKQTLIRGQENERKRLSQELHDGLGPLLTSLKLAVEAAELPKGEKKKVNEIVDRTISDIRRMTYDLMPLALEDFGVGKALLNFVQLIRKSTGIEIHYEYSQEETRDRLDIEIEICLFRVCQELINNSIKHSRAKKIGISLTEFTNKISLFYRDDGIGFNVETVQSGSGLRNIKERIEVFNGYLNILSGNDGTEVEVEIPLTNE